MTDIFSFFAAYTWTQLSEVLRLQHVSPWPKHCSHSGGAGGCFIVSQLFYRDSSSFSKKRESVFLLLLLLLLLLTAVEMLPVFLREAPLLALLLLRPSDRLQGTDNKTHTEGSDTPGKEPQIKKKKKKKKLESSEETKRRVLSQQLYTAFSFFFFCWYGTRVLK